MTHTNQISKVAIVGASGHLGSHFVSELLKTGQHTITALTRKDSSASLPPGIKVGYVDYNDEETLVAALRGQQFLVITLGVMAPADTHTKLVKAAVKAGVGYIIPNAYGYDVENKTLRDAHPGGGKTYENVAEVERLGGSYIAMTCGQWYEWSLALGEAYFGFDIKNKKVTFLDGGTTPISVSTWRQCGRALAALLSAPGSGASPSLSQWANKFLYISSFHVSQRDMLDSIHRVTGSSDKDWEISHEACDERYRKAMEEMKKGVLMEGFVKAMYSRLFFPGGGGDFEASRPLANEALGLPMEDLDEATKRAVEMVEGGFNPFNL